MRTSLRTTIRCPNCRKEGKAQAELLNRQVSCKHCLHVFLAVAADDSIAARGGSLRPRSGLTLIPASSPSGDRIGSLEREIHRLREALSSGRDLTGQVHLLRDRLAGASAELAAAKQAIEALRRDRDRIAAELEALRRERDGAFTLRDRPARPPMPDARSPLMDLPVVRFHGPTEARFPAINAGARIVPSHGFRRFDDAYLESAGPSDTEEYEGTKWPAPTGDSDEAEPSA